MSRPFKLEVLIALGEILKLAEFEHNGTTYDMADYLAADGRLVEKVVRGRDRFGDGDPLPMLSILEDPRAAEQLQSAPGVGGAVNTWPLMIMGFCPNDLRYPTDPAYAFAEAVENVLHAHRQGERRNLLGFGSLAPCVTEMKIGESVVKTPDPTISPTAFFGVRISLTLSRPPMPS